MRIRLAAALVLALQLSQSGLPLLCPRSHAVEPAGCTMTAASSSATVVSQSGSYSGGCANPALCGVLPVALRVPIAVPAAVGADARLTLPGAKSLHPAEPAEPPLPPPQA